MQVMFSSNGKLRQLMGAARLALDMPHGAPVSHVLQAVGDRFGEEAKSLVLGGRSGILVLVNDEMVTALNVPVADGDEVTVLLPMAGG